ncbi:unnamed protein product [Rangifer tarandus platyrhynchus]|uniref:Uncharacterized protein n=1 Tax=Rangifer tarandus platyrhynchus TaxID=3082113 RepID=A0AC59ZUL7_RANTA
MVHAWDKRTGQSLASNESKNPHECSLKAKLGGGVGLGGGAGTERSLAPCSSHVAARVLSLVNILKVKQPTPHFRTKPQTKTKLLGIDSKLNSIGTKQKSRYK